MTITVPDEVVAMLLGMTLTWSVLAIGSIISLLIPSPSQKWYAGTFHGGRYSWLPFMIAPMSWDGWRTWLSPWTWSGFSVSFFRWSAYFFKAECL